MTTFLAPVLDEPGPGPDASDAELTTFLWSMIREDFLTEAGWDAERRVMTPEGHPTMGGRHCPVPNCQSPVRGKKLCSTCYSRHRKSGIPAEEFIKIPRISRHLHLGTGTCRVSGCERPWNNSGAEPVCRAHRWQKIKHGGTLEEFLADPAIKGLPGLGDCSVLACNRQAVSEFGTRLCHPHGKSLPALRRKPGFDEEMWLRTAPSGSYGIEISFRSLPELVVAQLLFGLQHRCHRGARTEAGNFRALIDKTVRPSLAQRLEDVPDPAANSDALRLLNRTRIYAIRAAKTPEGEYAKDEWDLVAFGHRGYLVFTDIHQPWLRESGKRWARDYLSKVRSKSSASHAQQHLHGLVKLSDTLRARPDRGLDKAALARADIENFLNRMSSLETNDEMSTLTRIAYISKARNVLKQGRAMGLTRPGEPLAGLPDDFVITREDVPKPPEPSEEGQDLPAEVLRQLGTHLNAFEAMTCYEMRLSVELLMDTGRRPEEICRLELNCLTRDGQGKPVLLYNNWKEQRIGRQLPIHEPTAKLIIAQQKRVRARFPDRTPSKLVLLPTQPEPARGAVDRLQPPQRHAPRVGRVPARLCPRRRHRLRQGEDLPLHLPALLRPAPRGRRCRHRRPGRAHGPRQLRDHQVVLPGQGSSPARGGRTRQEDAVRPPGKAHLGHGHHSPRRRAHTPGHRRGRRPLRHLLRTHQRCRRRRSLPTALPLRGLRPLLHRRLLPPRPADLPR
ncbi:hypothetical protein [Streptomyces sp. YS415]|uniref:hypothetical protein n=1 Tax=Streptomyces sp. YS415 TaxID=2944806 RepID=UPI0020200AB6|nr:hypothetical protein [Streptomyces sp. YS415]MCL7430365.1 hypothetical protein [Streptomyces sp. YS415]